MRVLLVKTSSMGDLIHTMPALTDAANAIPGIQFDWVVEDVFASIPAWHPAVNTVIPVALRRWRKGFFSAKTWSEWRALRRKLRANQYDLVLDAQGLVKSALVVRLARGPRVGLDWSSARESLASLAYQRTCTVNFYQHAVLRMRELFSQALGYAMPTSEPDFGLRREQFKLEAPSKPYLVFLHGTTWASKLWPQTYWMQLADIAKSQGLQIKMSGGNQEEMARAQTIADYCSAVQVLPRLDIPGMAALLANAKAAVAVDTGFGHLAAALGVPTVSIYGSTNAEYTGALGPASKLLSAQFSCSPCLNRTCSYKPLTAVTPACYETVPPLKVWGALSSYL